MIRGEFIRGDGLVLPNNITPIGAEKILRMAMRDESFTLFMGLCEGVYTPTMTLAELTEPTIGTNGYARQAMTRDNAGWPTIGVTNGEQYVESAPHIFVPTGSGFNQDISRMWISDGLTSSVVLMLGTPLPAPIRLLSTTPVLQRTFTYRFYLR